MSNQGELNRTCEAFQAELQGDVVIIRFVNRPFVNLLRVKSRDEFREYVYLVSSCDKVKAVVLMNPEGSGGGEDYVEFLTKAFQEDNVVGLHRMCNIVNQFILDIVRMNRVVIHVDCGPVISQFFHMSLACDYRVVSDDLVIEKPYLKHGMIPKGGGAYFLCRMLGWAKAVDVLLSHRDITAQEALELGLVDVVTSRGSLEKAALEIAHRFDNKNTDSLVGTKRLLNYFLKDLEMYLEFENEEVVRSFQRARRKLGKT